MQNIFQRINIAIAIPENIAKETIRISTEISKKNNTYFILDGLNFIPHITLYSTEYPINNIPSVLLKVEKLLKKQPCITLYFTKIETNLGYIYITLKKTKELHNLHETIVNELNPLRDNHLRNKYLNLEELTKFTDKQQTYIKKYGYTQVFDSFIPHLTITRFKDEEKVKEITGSLEFPVKQFNVEKVAAFSMGDYGTCNKIIKEWTFK